MFKKYKETGIFDKNEIYPYITEGIGEDFLPKNVDFAIIDHFEKVTDKDAAIMTRRIAREEGIFAGNSAGSAMAGLLQLKDHFTAGRCRRRDLPRPRVALSRQDVQRRLDAREGLPREERHDARDLVAARLSGELCSIEANEPVEHALRVMSEHDFSQISITRDQAPRRLAERDASLRGAGAEPPRQAQPVESIMQPAFPFVDVSTPVDLLSTMITPQNPAVLVRDFKTDKTFIITRSDVIRVL